MTQMYNQSMQLAVLEQLMQREIDPRHIISKERLVDITPKQKVRVDGVCGNPNLKDLVKGTHYTKITRPLITELIKEWPKLNAHQADINDLAHSTMLSQFLDAYLNMFENNRPYMIGELALRHSEKEHRRGYLSEMTNHYYSLSNEEKNKQYPFGYVIHYILESAKALSKQKTLQGPGTATGTQRTTGLRTGKTQKFTFE